MIDIEEHIKRRKTLEGSILKIKELTSSHLLNLSSFNLSFGLHSLLLGNNITMAKQYFHNVALLDAFNINNYQSRLLDYDLPKVTTCLLSDNSEYLRNVYAKLRYNSTYIEDDTLDSKSISMDKMVLHGQSAIWCNTIQLFMANDIQGINKNLNIIETLTLPKLPKNQLELKIDYEFYRALLDQNKSKCEELLEQLVSPKIHRKRNDNDALAKFVSQPAIGYAKLAWRQGIEVDINSKLIPKEILPITPLERYEIPYDFLYSGNS